MQKGDGKACTGREEHGCKGKEMSGEGALSVERRRPLLQGSALDEEPHDLMIAAFPREA